MSFFQHMYVIFFVIEASIKRKRIVFKLYNIVGMKTSKIYAKLAKQHGGYENICRLEKNIRNHLDKNCRLAIELGDANAILQYFMLIQEENPRLFYTIDLDEECHLRNIFWVDGKDRGD